MNKQVSLPVYRDINVGFVLGDERSKARIMIADCLWVDSEGEDFSGRKFAEYMGLEVGRDLMLHFFLN